jgi:manganese/zinc/iron transport system ATP- binding protein
MREPQTNQVPAVAVSDLTVAYREKPVLWDVDLTIEPGRLAVIMGPNGAGKSTLIKAILNLVPAAAGTVRIFGKPYAEQRRVVGYVPQRGSVDWDFPTTALDVVLMGTYGRLGWVRRPGREEHAWALHCLEQVGMADFAGRQISSSRAASSSASSWRERWPSAPTCTLWMSHLWAWMRQPSARSSTCCAGYRPRARQ